MTSPLRAIGVSTTPAGLTSRRHVDYGRVRSAICRPRTPIV